ncbi:hypothetical protein [Vibrio rumoiensis]|uniref:hypothetical protein n=1 Tax=Vibrio rumoiensis TaxID=76258 RepID=UPI003AA80D33
MSFQPGNIVWFQYEALKSTFAICSFNNQAIYLCPKQKKVIETGITDKQPHLHTEQASNPALALQIAYKYKGLAGRLFNYSSSHFIGSLFDPRAEPKMVFDFLAKALGNGAMLNADRKAIMAVSTNESARLALSSTDEFPVQNEQIWACLQKGIRFYS